MSKKKKKKRVEEENFFLSVETKSKKKLNKEFKHALNEISEMRMFMYETDKKGASRKKRKKINKEESQFYTDMDSIKCRKKISKKWKKTGFIDQMIRLLKEISPMVQLLARALASLIILFFSVPFIKEHISPKIVSKLSYVFDIVMAI